MAIICSLQALFRVSRDALQKKGRKQFVLWLDAHTDFHTLETTGSGNLHGTPVAYYTGQKGFEGYFPAPQHRLIPPMFA